jgi:hypothetical protein
MPCLLNSGCGMPDFNSLTWAFNGWFDTQLCDLPDDLRQRVEQEFSPMPWDSLSADQRRSVALQLDYQHDPAAEQDRQFWWNFAGRQRAVEEQITEWEAVTAGTAGDLGKKEKRLTELRQELARMEQQQRQAGNEYHPARKSLNDEGRASPTSRDARFRYIAYPAAMKLLAERLIASPDELAAWVWMGPNNGGVAAYLHANELKRPQRFYYSYPGDGQGSDYLAPLMGCWFRANQLAKFKPTDRFITGMTLIDRWRKHSGVQPEAFIRAKIAESRLIDIHPIFGTTQGTFREDTSLPPLGDALFLRSHVDEIEASDFGTPRDGKLEPRPPQPAAPVLGSSEWRIDNAKKAADARHNKSGGTREKRARIQEIWATGKFSSRNLCAEQECDAIGMTYDAARRALRNTPEPKRP